jgi:hypothetical protein
LFIAKQVVQALRGHAAVLQHIGKQWAIFTAEVAESLTPSTHLGQAFGVFFTRLGEVSDDRRGIVEFRCQRGKALRYFSERLFTL